MKNKILTENPKPNTKEKILFAAKTEFLQKGFMGTNVRSIAKKAGVTTGAIYNQFKSKNDVFKAIIETVFADFLKLMHHNPDMNYNTYNMKDSDLSIITDISRRRFLQILDFFYVHWEEMKLLLCCAHGSSYERIGDKVIELVESETIIWLKRDNIAISKRTKFFIHVMISSQFSNLKEIFDHNLTKTEAEQYLLDMNQYHCAGWKQYWITRE